MKIDSYFVKINEDNDAEIIGKYGNTEIIIGTVSNAVELDSYQLHLRAEEMLRINNFEVSEESGQAVFMEDQRVDLQIVRNKMREVLKYLTDSSISIDERKERLEVYQSACHTAGIIVNTCKTELNIEQTAAALKNAKKK